MARPRGSTQAAPATRRTRHQSGMPSFMWQASSDSSLPWSLLCSFLFASSVQACRFHAYVRALGQRHPPAPRPAREKKTQMSVFAWDKICNTTAATSMAKATRQHVGRKSFTMDVLLFALKWPPLYYTFCFCRRCAFACFFPSLAVVL